MARMTVPEFNQAIIANGSNDLDSTDPAGTGGAPLAPTSFSAAYLTDTSLSQAWTDNATNELNYELDRSLTGTGGWTALADPAANATSATDTGLTVDTTYYYRLRAVNAAGNSSYATTSGLTTSGITALGGVDFDGLTDTESVVPLVSFYGTYGNGYGMEGDTAIKFAGNTSSSTCSIQTGTTGRPGDGAPAGNGDFGFIESLTDAGHAVADGGELWVYGKIFIPLGFDFSGAGGLGLKFIRFTFPGYGGKLDVHIGENGSGVNNAFSISNENFSQFQTDIHRETNKTLDLGAWNDFCFYVSATATTATTEMRLWINDEFMMEHVGAGADITTKWINPSGILDTATWTPAGGAFACLPDASETISSMYLFTYWNGNAPQDQEVNVQYMKYVQVGTGLAVDAYGNKYVDSSQVL